MKGEMKQRGPKRGLTAQASLTQRLSAPALFWDQFGSLAHNGQIRTRAVTTVTIPTIPGVQV